VDTRNATRAVAGDNVVGLSGIVPPMDASEDEVEASA